MNHIWCMGKKLAQNSVLMEASSYTYTELFSTFFIRLKDESGIILKQVSANKLHEKNKTSNTLQLPFPVFGSQPQAH